MAAYLDSNRRKPDGEALRKEGRKWVERIDASAKLEKDWIDDAEKANTAYTGERGSSTDGEDCRYDFNILFSNVETIVPAIINSPPQPDIRRRFADDDPVAKDGSELLERAIRIQVDDSRLQIEMEASAQDAFLAGRGVIRIRFKADVEGGEVDNDDLKELASDVAGHSGNPEYDNAGDDTSHADDEQGRTGAAVGGREATPTAARADLLQGDAPSVKNERIAFEAVSWRDFRRGPAKRWEDIPWCAFRHAMPMEDLEAFADKAITDPQTLPEDKLQAGDTDNDVVIWEIWCRKTRKVKFVEQDTGRILKVMDDPLGLTRFFPICTPLQPIEINGRLTPVNPFSIYRKLADELDTTTRRIRHITNQMRVRGWYPGDATELANMLDAGDNDFVPISNPELWAQNGGLDGAIAFWPIDKFILVLRELYANREQTKQAIYEITGISDIVRGASQGGVKSATEQQIKSQWGSLRIQKMQRMIERAARDLFVMMAEIIPAKFSAETLQQMTGIQLIPGQQDMIPVMPRIVPGMPLEAQQQAIMGAQQAEQARQKKLAHMQALNDLLNNNVARNYRIDVESDSTVRADLSQKKQEQAEFLQGTAAYFQSAGPAIEAGMISKEGAIEIYAATARLFTLGKSTEDALEREITKAKEAANQPQQPSPEQVKAMGEVEKLKAEAQRKDQEHQAKMAQIAAKSEADRQTAELKIGQMALDFETKQRESAMKLDEMAARMTEIEAKTAATVVSANAKIATAEASARKARQVDNG
ncbi:MAG: hypothetical protein RLW68_00850 [Devosia marina]|uniref:hypothetical protein n=1 Tax=Devosia marina TaxID=2683198 RepID=UPI0032EC85C7